MVSTSSKAKKASVKKTGKKAPAKKFIKQRKAVVAVSDKVDIYPNRMTVAVSALAGTLLVLLALIAVLGSQ